MTNLKSLNSTVFKLGLVSFFADIASEMLYPITPIFLTSVLGASMVYIGIIEGCAESIASLLKTYSGIWSDRISKRKPFIIAGYFLGAISKPLTALSTSWSGVLFARSLDRTGKGIRSSPRDAMIADSVDESQRGAAFGWHRGLDTLGAAVGPLLAILLLYLNANDLRSLYFWALIPGILSVAIIFLIKEPKYRTKEKSWKNPMASWKIFNRTFRKYVLAWSVFSVVNSSDIFLIMKAKASGISTQTVILLFCAYNLTYALSSPWLGSLSDKIGKKQILIFGLLIYAIVYCGFGLSNQLWHYWVLFLIYGLYMGATEGVSKALAIDLAPKEYKATSLGILGTATGITTLFASTFAGVLWEKLGSSSVFYFGAIGACMAAALLLGLKTERTSLKHE